LRQVDRTRALEEKMNLLDQGRMDWKRTTKQANQSVNRNRLGLPTNRRDRSQFGNFPDGSPLHANPIPAGSGVGGERRRRWPLMSRLKASGLGPDAGEGEEASFSPEQRRP